MLIILFSFVSLMARSTKEDFQRLNAFSLYNKTGHVLTQEPLPPGFAIYNFGRGFHAQHSYKFNFSEICLGVEKNCINFTVKAP